VPPPFDELRPGTEERRQKGQVLDDSTARTLQPELFSPLDVAPLPFVEHVRHGRQEERHFMDVSATSMKKNFVRRVQDLERSLLLDAKGEAMDVSTRTPHPEISFPLDFLDISTGDAIPRNPRQRSNQFLVEDGKLPVD
jgi:hypothetical protein